MYTMIPEAMRCTPGHRSCSWHHAQLVSDYRSARTAPVNVEFQTDPDFRIPPWTPGKHKSKKQLQREEYGT